jgi:hypothetical protein
MSCNYRVVEFADADGDRSLNILEIHYDDKGKPNRCTVNKVAVVSETIEGMHRELNRMRDDLDKPIMKESDFEKSG